MEGINGSEGVEVIGDTTTERIPVSTGTPAVPTQLPAEVPEQPSSAMESAAPEAADAEPVAEARATDG